MEPATRFVQATPAFMNNDHFFLETPHLGVFSGPCCPAIQSALSPQSMPI